MKKTMIVLGVVLCATLLVNPALACDGKEAKNASNEGATCSKSAAKAAYAKTLEETGCEKTAQNAYKNTLAENVYAKSYAETGCEKTAQAAYASITKTAGASCATAEAKANCDKGNAESSSEKVADADVKVASNEEGSSR